MLLKPLCRLQLIKTLKQSDAISLEIELGCGDKKHEKRFLFMCYIIYLFFIYIFIYLFSEKQPFQSPDRNYGFDF